MAKPKFSLQQVLNLKKSQKNQISHEIGGLEKEYSLIQSRIESLSREWEKESEALKTVAPQLIAAEYRLRYSYLDYIDYQIEEERKKLFAIARQLADKRQKYIQFSREQKILEKLKEKRLSEWRKEEILQEQARIDETAGRRRVYHIKQD